jgi:hypothetical protein
MVFSFQSLSTKRIPDLSLFGIYRNNVSPTPANNGVLFGFGENELLDKRLTKVEQIPSQIEH